MIARGEYEYHEHCQFCHGAGVIGGVVLPELRMLDAQGHASFLGNVLGGIHGSGMASFKDVLNVEQAQQIHEYIKHQMFCLSRCNTPKSMNQNEVTKYLIRH